MTKATAFGTHRDVTSKMNEVNEYDRIYETVHGYHAKVRVTPRPIVSDQITFDITGSWADDKGKARRYEDNRPFIVTEDQVTIVPDSPVDLEAELEAARLKMVDRVDLTAANYFAAAALKGVKRTSSVV